MNRNGNTPEEQREIDDFGAKYAIAIGCTVALVPVAMLAVLFWVFFGWLFR